MESCTATSVVFSEVRVLARGTIYSPSIQRLNCARKVVKKP